MVGNGPRVVVACTILVHCRRQPIASAMRASKYCSTGMVCAMMGIWDVMLAVAQLSTRRKRENSWRDDWHIIVENLICIPWIYSVSTMQATFNLCYKSNRSIRTEISEDTQNYTYTNTLYLYIHVYLSLFIGLCVVWIYIYNRISLRGRVDPLLGNDLKNGSYVVLLVF